MSTQETTGDNRLFSATESQEAWRLYRKIRRSGKHINATWKEIPETGGDVVAELSIDGSEPSAHNWIIGKDSTISWVKDPEGSRNLAAFDVMYRSVGRRVQADIVCTVSIDGIGDRLVAHSADIEKDGYLRWDHTNEEAEGAFTTFFPWSLVSGNELTEGESILLADAFPLDKMHFSFDVIPNAQPQGGEIN